MEASDPVDVIMLKYLNTMYSILKDGCVKFSGKKWRPLKKPGPEAIEKIMLN